MGFFIIGFIHAKYVLFFQFGIIWFYQGKYLCVIIGSHLFNPINIYCNIYLWLSKWFNIFTFNKICRWVWIGRSIILTDMSAYTWRTHSKYTYCGVLDFFCIKKSMTWLRPWQNFFQTKFFTSRNHNFWSEEFPHEKNRHAHHMYHNLFSMNTYFNFALSPNCWRDIKRVAKWII